jgi:ATP-binding cassette subfamily C protein LapB
MSVDQKNPKGMAGRTAAPAVALSWLSMLRADIFLLTVTINVLSLALPLVILQVYDRIIPEKAYDTFAILMAGIGVVIILDLVLRMIRDRTLGWSAARFEHKIGSAAVGKMMSAEIATVEAEPASLHLERLAAIEPLRDFQSGQILITLADIPFVVVFMGLIWLIAGNLVLAPAALVLAALITVVFLGYLLARAVKVRAELDDERYNFVFKVLGGIHTVKGLGLEAQMTRRYEAIMGPLSSAVERVAFLSSIAQALTPTFSNLAMVATAGYGSVMVVAGDISGGSLIACILLAGRVLQPIARLIGLWVQSRTVRLAGKRLNAILQMPDEEAKFPQRRPAIGPQAAATDADTAHPDDGIRLQDVTVHLGRPDYPVLDSATIAIPLGAFVVLSGPVGGGKSTFLDVLAGLAPADSGQIYYKGRGISDGGIDAYRAKVGYVREASELFRGTIKDNLTWFGDRSDLGLALQRARELGLDETVAMIPKGLGTPVGDSATAALPASVQQQISLVRVLSQSPEILLLDEANSAFDIETDRLFRDLLIRLKGQCTIVMITSRPSLAKLADIRIDINQGDVRLVTLSEATSTAPSSPAQPRVGHGNGDGNGGAEP